MVVRCVSKVVVVATGVRNHESVDRFIMRTTVADKGAVVPRVHHHVNYVRILVGQLHQVTIGQTNPNREV